MQSKATSIEQIRRSTAKIVSSNMSTTRTPPANEIESFLTPMLTRKQKKRKTSEDDHNEPMEHDPPSPPSNRKFTNDDIGKLLCAFRSEMNEKCNNQIDEITDLRTDLNNKLGTFEKDLTKTKTRVDKNTNDIDYLKRRMNEVDQDKLASHMEISGLKPEEIQQHKEDLKTLVLKTLKAYNARIDPDEIARVYVREVKMQAAVKSLLVVIFKNIDTKMNVMKKKKDSKTANTVIYFDHCLTAYTRALFMQARKSMKEIGGKTAFVSNGRVFIVLNDTEKPKRINSFEEIENIKLNTMK